MTTLNQLEANRLNAQHSTGPRSVQGRETVRFNAVQHGAYAESLVLPNEDPAALAELMRRYRDQFQPATVAENALVIALVESEWFQHRYARIEAKVIELSIDPALDPAAAVATLFLPGSKTLSTLRFLARRRQQAEREWHRSFKELQQMQKDRKQTQPAEPAPVVEMPPGPESPKSILNPELKPLDLGCDEEMSMLK
jgi:hypothetical protein